MMAVGIPPRASAKGKSTRACWMTNEAQPKTQFFHIHLARSQYVTSKSAFPALHIVTARCLYLQLILSFLSLQSHLLCSSPYLQPSTCQLLPGLGPLLNLVTHQFPFWISSARPCAFPLLASVSHQPSSCFLPLLLPCTTPALIPSRWVLQ